MSIASEETEAPLRIYREQPGSEFNASILTNAIATLTCGMLLLGIVFVVEPFNYNSREPECVVDSAVLVKQRILPNFYRVECHSGSKRGKIRLREHVELGTELPAYMNQNELIVGGRAMFSASWLLALLVPAALIAWKLIARLIRGPKLGCDELA